MNKILIRSVTITLIILITGFLILLIFKNRSPFGKSNTSFASEPSKEITRIEFSQGKRKLVLEKSGENWLLNGTTETRKSGIQFIIRVLKEIKIKSPVSHELFDTEIRNKGIVPVRVKVFAKQNLLKTFLIYKTGSNIYGNIMKMRDGSKPFIVYVPGYDGEISSAFTLNELFWQPYRIFNLMPSEISSVKFENYSDTASSFTIESKNRLYVMSYNSGLKSNTSVSDSARIARYLSYFAWIPFERWAFELGDTEKKAIELQKPLYRIIVITTGGKKIVLTLWERMSGEKGEKEKDSDRLLGKTENSNDFFIIRYFDIDPLIKKRSYFFQQ